MITVEAVDVDRIRALRAAVLRPGLPLEEAAYPEDDDPGTLHLAAYDEDGHVVGCATWFAEPWEGRPAWRLRGMATDPQARAVGVGSALMQRGLAEAKAAGMEAVWCNARTVAVGFYRRHGFTTVGDEFLLAHGIPHYVMWRTLAR